MNFWYYIKWVPSEKIAFDIADEIFECGPCSFILALKATVGMFI